jgi:hypothetical protein
VVVEALGNLVHWQHRHARSRQFDRQRNAVDAPEDLGDRRGVGSISAKYLAA